MKGVKGFARSGQQEHAEWKMDRILIFIVRLLTRIPATYVISLSMCLPRNVFLHGSFPVLDKNCPVACAARSCDGWPESIRSFLRPFW